MEFDELLTQVITLLQRQGRVSYGALKRRFQLDDDYLEDLKVEIIEAQGLAVRRAGPHPDLVGRASRGPTSHSPRPSETLQKRHSPTRRHISPRRFSPPALPWKASASRSRCSLPTSRAPRS